jgi:thiol-disulfide isomerase/thioredoxin
MLKFFIALVLGLSVITSNSYAQELVFKPFTEQIQNTEQGEYYLLVTAKWCAPCKVLKQLLTKFSDREIYELDLDANPDMVRQLLGQNISLPVLLKYKVQGQNKQRQEYVKGSSLDAFFATSAQKEKATDPKTVEKETPAGDKPEINFQGPLDKLAEKIEERLKENQSKMDEVLTDLRNRKDSNEPTLTLLRGMRDSIRGFEGLIKRLQESNDNTEKANAATRGILSNLADRIDTRVDALSGSNDRLFVQVKDLIKTQQELRQDSKEVFSGLRDLIDRGRNSEKDIAEIKESIKIRPGQKILTRLDEFFALFTENILKFIMYLFVIILAMAFLLSFVLMLAAAFVHLIKKIFSKITFGLFE